MTLDSEIKDYFEFDDLLSICYHCKWIDKVSDAEHPCSHCTHNTKHLR